MRKTVSCYTSTQEPGTVEMRAVPQDELIILRRRVKAQRAELRRLNKYLGPYWAGFSKGCQVSDAATLRGKMAKVFGWEAVRAAENGQ